MELEPSDVRQALEKAGLVPAGWQTFAVKLKVIDGISGPAGLEVVFEKQEIATPKL